MKIDTMVWEHRNDFTADLRCEHCGHKQRLTTGYHDNYYHTQVLPKIRCGCCGRDRQGNEVDTFEPKEVK
jgi:phage terminase large subunit GpA-like protein